MVRIFVISEELYFRRAEIRGQGNFSVGGGHGIDQFLHQGFEVFPQIDIG